MVRTRGKNEFEPDEPDPEGALTTLDPDVPDVDTVEQHQGVFDDDEAELEELHLPPDVPEADAVEQRQDVPPRE
jgi:hypothetical protein